MSLSIDVNKEYYERITITPDSIDIKFRNLPADKEEKKATIQKVKEMLLKFDPNQVAYTNMSMLTTGFSETRQSLNLFGFEPINHASLVGHGILHGVQVPINNLFKADLITVDQSVKAHVLALTSIR